jgi:hypothetical protein
VVLRDAFNAWAEPDIAAARNRKVSLSLQLPLSLLARL